MLPGPRRLLIVAPLLAAGLVACGEKPQPAPAPAASAPAPASGLQPLTSRDNALGDAPAAAAPAPGTGDMHAMPPGHPPVGQAAHGAARAAEGGTVSGTIEVDPKLQARVKGGALFVIARN